MLKYDPGGGRMKSTREARSRIRLSVFPRERSLEVPYEIIQYLMRFPGGWEERAMSSKAATLAEDTGVEISPDLRSAWGGLIHWSKTGYPKFQPLAGCCLQSPLPRAAWEPEPPSSGERESHSRADSTYHKSRGQSFKHQDFSTLNLQSSEWVFSVLFFKKRTLRRRFPVPLPYIIL